MKLYVKGSAKRLSDIKDDIDEKTPELIEVLAQLYIFPDTEYENHWRKEVWNKFLECPGQKEETSFQARMTLWKALRKLQG